MTIFLSTEQQRAASISTNFSWSELDRPCGPQELPSWVRDVHVDWVERYSNSPRITLKVTENVRDWPNKRFSRSGDRYIAKHADGRLEQYAHAGRISLAPVSMFKRDDGLLSPFRRQAPGTDIFGDMIYEDGEWVQIQMPCTTTQDGFGGSRIFITMDDESPLCLVGPWHVSSPEGYAEVAYVDASRVRPSWEHPKDPWWKTTAIGGLYLQEQVFIAIMSRFAAHLPLARVTYGGCTTIEPYKAEWGKPKRLVYEDELNARRAIRKSA